MPKIITQRHRYTTVLFAEVDYILFQPKQSVSQSNPLTGTPISKNTLRPRKSNLANQKQKKLETEVPDSDAHAKSIENVKSSDAALRTPSPVPKPTPRVAPNSNAGKHHDFWKGSQYT